MIKIQGYSALSNMMSLVQVMHPILFSSRPTSKIQYPLKLQLLKRTITNQSVPEGLAL